MKIKKISLSLISIVAIACICGAGRRALQSGAQYGDLLSRAIGVVERLEQTYSTGQTLTQAQVNDAAVMLESLNEGAPKQANELLVRLLRLQLTSTERLLQAATNEYTTRLTAYEREMEAAVKERGDLVARLNTMRSNAANMLSMYTDIDLALGITESIIGVAQNLKEKVDKLPTNEDLITLSPAATNELRKITASTVDLANRIPNNIRTRANQLRTIATSIAS